MNEPLVIIPARLESQRLPAKLLRRLGPRSLLEWSFVAACRAGYQVLIATDSQQIEREALNFGARTVRTGPARNGTERCALAVATLKRQPEIVINWQGDCPLCPAWVARSLVRAFEDEASQVATPVRPIEPPARIEPGQAVAVRAHDGRALYFSRGAVPPSGPWWGHIGMYAYRRSALERYGTVPSPLEASESLEQNRWLEIGVPVRCVAVSTGPVPEVNESRDLTIVAQALGCYG